MVFFYIEAEGRIQHHATDSHILHVNVTNILCALGKGCFLFAPLSPPFFFLIRSCFCCEKCCNDFFSINTAFLLLIPFFNSPLPIFFRMFHRQYCLRCIPSYGNSHAMATVFLCFMSFDVSHYIYFGFGCRLLLLLLLLYHPFISYFQTNSFLSCSFFITFYSSLPCSQQPN